MGFKSMKMGWDICSSPPWVTFYPYTMFQNPISWPSHNKCRKTIITQKVLVTQSCNKVHCNWHTQKPICADLQVFVKTLSLWKLMLFSVFVRGQFRKQWKIHICWFWLGTMHWNSLSSTYLGFEVCQIQWQRFMLHKFHILLILTGKNAEIAWVVHI